MQPSGRRDNCSIDPTDQTAVIGQRFAVKLGGNAVSVRCERIGYSYKFDLRMLTQFLGVKAAQPACSHDGGANYLHNGYRCYAIWI
jgi:hypothetical protein